MILVDAVYLNSPGGVVLLQLFLDSLLKDEKSKTVLLLDYRLKNKLFVLEDFKHVFFCKNNEFSRFYFYLKIRDLFDKVLCFSNVPPPIFTLKKSVETFVFFHNILILEPIIHFYNLFKIRSIKSLYIKFFNKSKFNWIVQNEEIKNLLKNQIPLNRIIVAPFFYEFEKTTSNSENAYFYPSSGLPHKNHRILFQAWELLHKINNNKIPLYVTLNSQEFSTFSKGLNSSLIINLGNISHKDVLKRLRIVKYLIFPSLKESFGLPLIESTYCGNCILCSKSEVSNALVKDAYFFDPLSINDIIDKVLLSQRNHISSKLLIKNQIETLKSQLYD